MAKIYRTRKNALKELKRRRNKGDLKSNIYQLTTNKFFVGTRKQAFKEIDRRKL